MTLQMRQRRSSSDKLFADAACSQRRLFEGNELTNRPCAYADVAAFSCVNGHVHCRCDSDAALPISMCPCSWTPLANGNPYFPVTVCDRFIVRVGCHSTKRNSRAAIRAPETPGSEDAGGARVAQILHKNTNTAELLQCWMISKK